MDKRLLNRLVQIANSDEPRFPTSTSLLSYCRARNLGTRLGEVLIFSTKDKDDLRALLKAEQGIDPAHTVVADLAGLSRADTLKRANNEKLTDRRVGEGRLQVKALAGQHLAVAGNVFDLPERCDLGIDLAAILAAPIGHGAILVVENKETFLDLWRVRQDLIAPAKATRALAVFRGDAQGGSSVAAVYALIEATDLPVFAFVDYDPAGMVIASGLPRLGLLIAPPAGELADLLMRFGLRERFEQQLAAATIALDALETHPIVGPVWKLISRSGKALAQERFH